MLLKGIKYDSDVFYKHKLNKILELKKTTSHLPAQGTKKWLEIRKKCFGGSEIGTLLGLNPYQNIKKLIANKVGLTKFFGNQYTRWGNIFENVTIRWIEDLFDTKIYEFSSLPGFMERQRFSPDGIGVFKLKCEDIVKGKKVSTVEYIILLMEFKSPACSIPDGKTPVHYAPQIMTGLMSVKCSEVGLFVNNMYRKCSYDVLGYNKYYDVIYHGTDKRKEVKVDNPIACGVILVYQTDEQKSRFADKYGFIKKESCGKYDFSDSDDSDDSDKYNFSDSEEEESEFVDYNVPLPEMIYYSSGFIDFGRIKYLKFNELLKMHEDDLVSIEHTNIVTFYEEIHRVSFLDSQIEKSKDYKEELRKCREQVSEFKESLPNFIGVVPWKLFKSDMIIHHKDLNYHEKKGANGKSLDKIISDTSKILDIILEDSPPLETVYKRFHEIFPYDGKYHDRTLKKDMEYMISQK